MSSLKDTENQLADLFAKAGQEEEEEVDTFKGYDWPTIRAAEEIMKGAGMYPMLCLTVDDVEAACDGEEVPEEIATAALDMMKRKWDSGWADALVEYVRIAQEEATR